MASRIQVIEAVFEKELYTCPPLMPVVVARLKGTKTDLSRVFQAAKNFPLLEELKHLRRIHDCSNGEVDCIICRYVPSEDKASVQESLLEIEENIKLRDLLSEFRLIEVPASAPQTELQRKACQLIWPCKYAKNDYLNKCLNSEVFEQTDRLILDKIVDHSIMFINDVRNQCSSVAVIFRKNKIYAFASTSANRIRQNMTLHAPMVAIDNVARGLGGGHWKKFCEIDDNSAQQLQTRLDTDDNLSNLKVHNDPNPYLCTNYDIFVTEEPCFMCVMALVQSRIRRLFYLNTNSLDQFPSIKQLCFPDKAIEKHLLHRDRRLNHRFEAWKILLNNLRPEAQTNPV